MPMREGLHTKKTLLLNGFSISTAVQQEAAQPADKWEGRYNLYQHWSRLRRYEDV